MNKKHLWSLLSVAFLFSSHALSTTTTTTKKVGSSSTDETNVNFVDWISDAPDEITKWKPLPVVGGEIPEYVQGTLIRNGGGIWSDKEGMFSHIFDGLAKIRAYRIRPSKKTAKVEYQDRFVQGAWYKSYHQNENELPWGIGTGPLIDSKAQTPIITGIWKTVKALVNVATIFDNTPVNLWDYQPQNSNDNKVITALTDAPPRNSISLDTMDTVASSTMNPIAKDARGYELLVTAHPLYSQTESSSSDTVDTYNVATEIGLNGPRVNVIRESATSGSQITRSVVASFPSSDGIPYCHSFGLSKNYAVIVLQPLRINYDIPQLLEKGFLRSMTPVDTTRVVVIQLDTGDIVMDQALEDPIYFYHSISTAEYEQDDETIVSLRLCAYSRPNQLTGEHQFLRMEQAQQGRKNRNKLEKGGTFCDVECNLTTQRIVVDWKTDITQGFELPLTRYSRSVGPPPIRQQPSDDTRKIIQNHPRFVYAFGAYALGSKDYDNWGLFKFDLQENRIAGVYQEDSVYTSEPVFVPNPSGENEDDGCLLASSYFGKEQETKLIVVDATTMNLIAVAPTGVKSPIEFHGVWIPDKCDEEQ